MKLMYEDFATSSTAFYRARGFWSELISSCIIDHGVSDEWETWFEHDYLDTYVHWEAIGIASFVNKRRSKGVLVNQLNLSSVNNVFGAYIDVFAARTRSPIHYLNVSCLLSEDNAVKTRGLFLRWLLADTSPQDMAAFIEEASTQE